MTIKVSEKQVRQRRKLSEGEEERRGGKRRIRRIERGRRERRERER